MTNDMINTDGLRDAIAPLYECWGNNDPQKAYIWIDEDGTAWAAPWTEPNNTELRCVRYGTTLIIPVCELVLGADLADFLESDEFAALLARVHGGHSIDHDGRNRVGSLTEDAQAAIEEIKQAAADLPSASCEEASQYLDNSITKEDGKVLIEGVGEITADTSDEELTKMTKTIEDSALEDTPEKTLVFGTLGFLEKLRYDLQ